MGVFYGVQKWLPSVFLERLVRLKLKLALHSLRTFTNLQLHRNPPINQVTVTSKKGTRFTVKYGSTTIEGARM